MVLKLNFVHNEVRLWVGLHTDCAGWCSRRYSNILAETLKRSAKAPGFHRKRWPLLPSCIGPTIEAIERGERNVSLLSIVKLAKGLGNTVSELTAAL